MVAWITKIFLHASEPITEVDRFITPCGSATSPPGWWRTFVGTFVCVISITIYVSKSSSGEISEFGTHRSLWRI